MGSPLQSEPTLSVPREIGRGTILDRWRLPDGTLYLDNAATRPMLPEVAEEMARLMANNPLNASSQHKYGQKAARMLEDARNFFKSELNVPSTGELIFNSGATEGLNMLLKSAYFADPTKNHIVTVKTEHKAVLNTCAYLETTGAEVTYLDVDDWGQVSVSDVEAATRSTTCAVCVTWVNNETGALLNIQELSLLCKVKNVKLLVDGTQALGKHDCNLEQLDGVDCLVGSAHKLGGPIGVGFAWCRSVDVVMPAILGGGQEFDKRSGTVNVAGIVAFQRAWENFSVGADDCTNAKKELAWLTKAELDVMSRSDDRFSPYIIVAKASASRLDFVRRSKVSVSFGGACSSGLEAGSHVYRQVFGDRDDLIRISF